MTKADRVRRDRVVAELAALLRPDAGPGASDPSCGWEAVLAAAAAHRLLPALWSALVARGVRRLPEDLVDARRADTAPIVVLERAYDENAARVTDLRRQGEDLLAAFDAAGVDAMPLKGLHWLLVGWLPDPAARVMVDIDLLVPAGQAAAVTSVAAELGYRAIPVEDPEGLADHELMTVGVPGRMGSVEFQTAPLVCRYQSVLPTEELYARSTPIVSCGRRQRVPDATHAMVLVIAHAQLQDECHRLIEVPLRALHDVALLVGRGLGNAVNWDEVTRCFERGGARRALAGFAVACRELFGTPVPVPTAGGRSWTITTRSALRHPGLALRYREAAMLPRALAAERMARLYGAQRPGSRIAARAWHLARGACRRLAGVLRCRNTAETRVTSSGG